MKNLLIAAGLMFVIGTGVAQTKAPDFALKTAENKTIEMKKLAGKVVVINFWATWCRPCVVEMPGFSEMYDRYRGKGLEIIGVSLDQGGWARVKPFLERNSVSYPIVLGDDNLYLAFGGEDAIPTTVFVDRNGIIKERHVGTMSKEQFESMIKEML